MGRGVIVGWWFDFSMLFFFENFILLLGFLVSWIEVINSIGLVDFGGLC